MAGFTLPRNSRIVKGRTWKAEDGRRLRAFRIYRYDFDPRFNYYYGDGYLYRVDPKTELVRQVVSALLYR